MSLFDNMNRKQRRAFRKLTPEEQAPIIEKELISKISPVMSKELAKDMITGMNMALEKIYNDYVVPIDNAFTDEESEIAVNNLLSFMRTEHLRIEAEKSKENKKDEV